MASINRKILSAYDALKAKIKSFSRRRWFVPLLLFLVFLIIFLSFVIGIFSRPIYEGPLYQKELVPGTEHYDYNVGRAIETDYRAFLSTYPREDLIIAGIVIFALAVVPFLYLVLNHRRSTALTIVFLFALALIFRLTFMVSVDAIMRLQHDVWSTQNNGHLAMTFSFYYFGKSPPFLKDFDASYQLYHPKEAHLVFALWMHVAALFVGQNEFVLYQSLKVVSTFMSFMIYVLTYLILKKLNVSKRAIVIAMIITLFLPSLFFTGVVTNNDTFLFFFIYLSIYFGICLYQKPSWANFILSAVAVGMAVGAKLTGALVALPYLALLISVLVREIKARHVGTVIGKCALFALVSLPLGLFWPIFNYLKYGYPLTYVFEITNQHLAIDPSIPFYDRLLGLDLAKFFASPFVYLAEPGGYEVRLWALQDHEFIAYLMKCQLFGEWRLAEEWLVPASLLLSADFVFTLIVFFLGAAAAVSYAIRKRPEKIFYYFLPFIVTFALSSLAGGGVPLYVGVVTLAFSLIAFLAIARYRKPAFNLAYFVNSTIFILFITSYVFFNVKEPFTPTMDFRYVVPILLPFAYLSGTLVDRALSAAFPAEKTSSARIANAGAPC